MSTQAAATANIRDYLQITASAELLTDAMINECVDRAVTKYSKHRAREMKYDVIGNGEYSYALPSDWVDRFSYIMDIEYPGSDQIPNDIDRNEARIVRVDVTERGIANVASGATSITLSTVANAGYFKDGDIISIKNNDVDAETNWASADGNRTTGVVTLKNAAAAAYSTSPEVRKLHHIRFLEDSPLSSEYFTLKYTIPHTLSSSVDTIPSSDFEALCHLGAFFAANEISALFAKRQDSSIGADAVSYETKSTTWREVAAEQERIYKEHVGIGVDVVAPSAGLFIDTDVRFQHGRRLLFHGGRAR